MQAAESGRGSGRERRASSAGRGRTFTEEARRAQIVGAALETVAELGYTRASFAQIAKRAGLSSTGLISYHFKNRTELFEQVIEHIYADIGAFMAERLSGHETASAALRAYIEGNIAFTGTHRTQMKALLDIFVSGGLGYDAEAERSALSPLEQILRRGQEAGEFREFDVRVIATSIQRSVEGPSFLLANDAALDLEAYSRELVTMFELATHNAENS